MDVCQAEGCGYEARVQCQGGCARLLCGRHFDGGELWRPLDFLGEVLEPKDVPTPGVYRGRISLEEHERLIEVDNAIRAWTDNRPGAPECIDCLHGRVAELSATLRVARETKQGERARETEYGRSVLALSVARAFEILFLTPVNPLPDRHEVISSGTVLSDCRAEDFVRTALARLQAAGRSPEDFALSDIAGRSALARLARRARTTQVYWFAENERRTRYGLTPDGRFVYHDPGDMAGGSFRRGGRGYAAGNPIETIRALVSDRQRLFDRLHRAA